MTPETCVLTADLRWVPIGLLRIGSTLMGFNKTPLPGKGRSSRPRQWCRAKVEAFDVTEQHCYDLIFNDGTKIRCSSRDQWLVYNRTEGARWKTTEQLKGGSTHVVKPLDVWALDDTRSGGYLAAAFDGEGHITQTSLSDQPRGAYRFRLGFSQKKNAMLREVKRLLRSRRYTTSSSENKKTNVQHVVVGNRHDVFRFLGSTRPLRLLSKFDPDHVGAMTLRSVRLIEKAYVGLHHTTNIETTTGTCIAEGFAGPLAVRLR